MPYRRWARWAGIAMSCSAMALASAIVVTAGARADSNTPMAPLPVFKPTPTDWGPNVNAFPYNLRQGFLNPSDTTSMTDMCEWFNAQSGTLFQHINDFNGDLATNNDDYGADNLQKRANALVRNLDQTVTFLAPRAEALTFRWNYSEAYDGEQQWNVDGGQQFYYIWQQLSNFSSDLKNHNPAWMNNFAVGIINLQADYLHDQGICD